MKDYKLISGACKGADLAFESIGEEFGLGGIQHYTPDSYDRLNDYGKEIVEENYKMVCASLKRPVISSDTYAGKLVRRNMMIALKASSVFAIGSVVFPGEKDYRGNVNSNKYTIMEGGAAYSIELSRLMGKPTYIYDQDDMEWLKLKGNDTTLQKRIPTLTKVFAGIGTRNINNYGMQAIIDLYEFNIGL